MACDDGCMCDTCLRYDEALDCLRETAVLQTKAEQKNKRLLAALRACARALQSVEYESWSERLLRCQFCGYYVSLAACALRKSTDIGHRHDCPRQAALALAAPFLEVKS